MSVPSLLISSFLSLSLVACAQAGSDPDSERSDDLVGRELNLTIRDSFEVEDGNKKVTADLKVEEDNSISVLTDALYHDLGVEKLDISVSSNREASDRTQENGLIVEYRSKGSTSESDWIRLTPVDGDSSYTFGSIMFWDKGAEEGVPRFGKIEISGTAKHYTSENYILPDVFNPIEIVSLDTTIDGPIELRVLPIPTWTSTIIGDWDDRGYDVIVEFNQSFVF